MRRVDPFQILFLSLELGVRGLEGRDGVDGGLCFVGDVDDSLELRVRINRQISWECSWNGVCAGWWGGLDWIGRWG